MLEFFGDAIGAILGGGATGLLGSALTLWGQAKQQKELFRHNEKMAEIQGANLRLEAEMNLRQIQVEGEVKIGEIETKAFSESFSADKASYLGMFADKVGSLSRFWRTFVVVAMALVDMYRGFIRPGLTTYLVVLTTMIYMEVRTILGGIEGGMSAEGAERLLSQIIMVILYLTATVVLWWFGTRQKIMKGAA